MGIQNHLSRHDTEAALCVLETISNLTSTERTTTPAIQNDESNHYEQKRITRIDTNMAADRLLTFTGIVMNTFT